MLYPLSYGGSSGVRRPPDRGVRGRGYRCRISRPGNIPAGELVGTHAGAVVPQRLPWSSTHEPPATALVAREVEI